MSESGYSLIVSFPDQSASFVHGFEAGKLDTAMACGVWADIEVTTHTENHEVIRRLAIAQGWEVEFKPSDVDGWEYATLKKTKKAPEKPNPHGLRVVGPEERE
jgi:hypothetical protein